ncbi:16S rRNA (cytidine(1402)-2'-O)-methyltransferase [Anoxybacillus rupiensis]|jgi:16S rRNA (cytidine1402-2'-O)-methyltransferase|uniref:Ribosomal RNA small subunit methyltransferase I n=1 Tax=Anoxybacteroides rupiense TaxID=311460 RepID=A0ABD5IWC9_9BACL|nr:MULTISPECIES: 16S rRNA (cytidine(1402)-2'-O)-methyltransferase [Anoxybacillus]MBS2772717.1 16S rRNA (cytidine(1402)-2'-O)-methyltransferase [Anoxybacillus rupiensis]MDE8565415.1 16S rRNA (cytidine(1402)-2'-O)-methyltransferase [Anoxybacillus rupiensis]MED5052647.1 16S rRNA (cytidine(1402)-2'-O)-methyltransferase [Anoxybacillus rupiensis]QHC02608.1 16S rRNA (cytidine(1402)-2'-O)-methyltransferase [Anoxybacillus sp. PDR2]
MVWQQKSFAEQTHQGTLYIVPTPIGNLEDITFRALRVLKEADMIAAEDTRQTKKLLNHFEITTPIISYHEHNKYTAGKKIVEWLQEGKTIALVSDAGMPAISDPGYDLVAAALEERCPVVPLPGANAALTSLVASGLPTEHFYFFGFLDRAKKEKKQQLEALKNIRDTMIFYESPHRLADTLAEMHEVMGERKIAIGRELTKRFEEFIRGTISEVIEWTKNGEIRGEFCIIVEGAKENEEQVSDWWHSLSVSEHVDYYIDEKHLSVKDAIKEVAKDRKVPKREIYQEYHQ